MSWDLEISTQVCCDLARGKALRPVRLALGQSLVVGRNPNCDICMPDRFVSRQHARVWRDEDGVWVEDLNSLNGTCWEGHRHPVQARIQGLTRLEVDDLLRAGDSGLILTARFPVEQWWHAWDGGVVPRLARAIQDGESWGELPILADALEESGCEEVELLRHFRELPHRMGWCAVLRHLLDGFSRPALRRAHWWERLFLRRRFPAGA